MDYGRLNTKSKFIPILIFSLVTILFVSGCIQQQDQQQTTTTTTKILEKTTTTETMTTTTASEATATITIKGFAFSPPTLTINVGTTVTWINEDSVRHTVTGDGFDSGSLSKGETFSYTFNEAGTFEYTCTIHPNMKGTIVVQ